MDVNGGTLHSAFCILSMYKYLRLGIRCRRRPKTPGIPGLVQSVAPVGWGGSYRSVLGLSALGGGGSSHLRLSSSPHSDHLDMHSARALACLGDLPRTGSTGRPCLRLGDGWVLLQRHLPNLVHNYSAQISVERPALDADTDSCAGAGWALQWERGRCSGTADGGGATLAARIEQPFR